MGFLKIILLTILLIVVVPTVVAFLFIYLLTAGFNLLEFSLPVAFLVVLFMIVASSVNIPVGKRSYIEVIEPRFFGLFNRTVKRIQGVSVNLGGAVIPLIIAGVFISTIKEIGLLRELMIITGVITVVSFVGSRFVKNRGVVISIILPVLFTTLFSIILAPEEVARVAFSSGVLGVVIGSDLLHLPYALKNGKSVISIGGAGIFDGIFLVGILSALLGSML
ncbi:MAG: DUF1614 domain-containing protein [Patescibacteria group bacterium]|jgi:uncharacterized membrane protein|nr:DUF1614 domain-containing protein [Patescibacteria group bacterium]